MPCASFKVVDFRWLQCSKTASPLFTRTQFHRWSLLECYYVGRMVQKVLKDNKCIFWLPKESFFFPLLNSRCFYRYILNHDKFPFRVKAKFFFDFLWCVLIFACKYIKGNAKHFHPTRTQQEKHCSGGQWLSERNEKRFWDTSALKRATCNGPLRCAAHTWKTWPIEPLVWPY